MCKVIITLVLVLSCSSLIFAQSFDNSKKVEQRKGFTFGVGLGVGALKIATNDTVKTSFSPSIPNLKIGYIINERLVISVLAPGIMYKYEGKNRGFEGFVLTGQYWVKDRWWILGGTGLSFDAPVFWDALKDYDSSDFHIGLPALTFATGYEIYRKRNFALDIHYRFYSGRVKLENDGKRSGIGHMFVFGLNWY